jgi:hypothetical protein
LLRQRLQRTEQSYPAAEKRVVPIAPKAAQVDAKIYEAYVVRYQLLHHDRDSLPYTIAHQGDTLTAKGRDDPKYTLRPLSATRFWNADWGEFVFERDTCSASNIKTATTVTPNRMCGQKRRIEPSS